MSLYMRVHTVQGAKPRKLEGNKRLSYGKKQASILELAMKAMGMTPAPDAQRSWRHVAQTR